MVQYVNPTQFESSKMDFWIDPPKRLIDGGVSLG